MKKYKEKKKWGIEVRKDVENEKKIERIRDLGKYIEGGGKVVMEE